MANWTHYWQRSTMLDEASSAVPAALKHSASNSFLARGVATGDRIYVISNHSGKFFLIGRLIVDRIVDQATATKYLGFDLWDADDHALAVQGTEMTMRFDVTIPLAEVRRLEFVSKSGLSYPKLTGSGVPDRQTFRGVREVTDKTAVVFDRGLGL